MVIFGFIILAVVIWGLETGFTGYSYPLVVISLGLSAFGFLNPLWAWVFVPLLIIHILRFTSPHYKPMYLAKTGIDHVLNPFAFAFVIIIIFPNLMKMVIYGVIAIIIIFLTMFFFTKAINWKEEIKMLKIFNSTTGKRYYDLMNKTGKICKNQGSKNNQISELSNLVTEKEQLDIELTMEGVDPEDFLNYMAKMVENGEIPEPIEES